MVSMMGREGMMLSIVVVWCLMFDNTKYYYYQSK